MKDPKQFRERFKKWKEGTPIEEIYDNGRPTEYVEYMKRLAQPMAKNWGISEKEAYVHLLNDDSYDYYGWWKDGGKNIDPKTMEAAKPPLLPNDDGHFPDTYKTAKHPTFSNQSKYSGVVHPKYNPLGIHGGAWLGDTYLKGPMYLPGYSGGKDDRTYIGGSNQELVVTPGKSWVNPYTGEYTRATESYTQPIATKDPYVDYQFYSPTGNSIVQTINSTPRWQQYWANREGGRVSNSMHQASPKVLDLLTIVDAVATGPEMLEGLYGLYNLAKKGIYAPHKISKIKATLRTQKITEANAASITPEQWTAAQDAAIARGDIAEAQRLRDLHFKVNAPNTIAKTKDGPLRLFHGTKNKFNSFDLDLFGSTDGGTFGRGIYTTPSESYASLYGENVIPLYMKLDNPRKLSYDALSELPFFEEKVAFGPDFATGNGIDGVYGTTRFKQIEGAPEYVSHKPVNVKLADAVTYDDNGVRIPLGLRDNFNINDIRYGLIPLGLGLGAATLPEKYARGKDSGIYIKPSKRGTFTAAAKKRGMSVLSFASKVLKNPSNYSKAMRKKALFAKNASKFKH